MDFGSRAGISQFPGPTSWSARPCDRYASTRRLTLAWVPPSGNPSLVHVARCYMKLYMCSTSLPVVYSAHMSHADNLVCQVHQHVMYARLSAALGLVHRCCLSSIPNTMHTNSPVSLPFSKKRFRFLILIWVSFFGPVVLNVLEEPF